MEVLAEMKGADALGRVLENLPKKLARRALAKAVRAAKNVWVAAMQANAPELTGDLKRAITFKISVDLAKGKATLKVGVRYRKDEGQQSPGVYAMFLEFGTAEMAPHPFIRRTFDDNKDAALNAFMEVLASEIQGAIVDSL